MSSSFSGPAGSDTSSDAGHGVLNLPLVWPDMSYLPRQDVGNVVFLEHINLEVDDLEVARMFYCEGLGLVQDPSTLGKQRGGFHVLWLNIGRQQFHIARGEHSQTIGQGGVIGLVLPNVDDIYTRMQEVKAALGGRAGRLDCRYTQGGADTLHITDPYGNRFVIHSYLPAFPGTHGIAHINLPCHVGTSRAIGAFYTHLLGALVVRMDAQLGRDGNRLLGTQAEGVAVILGPGMLLVFVEDASLGQRSDQAVAAAHSGWHLAIYVCDFSGTYSRLEANALILNDHPFRDKCQSLEEALANRQCRFRDIPLRALAWEEGQDVMSPPGAPPAGGAITEAGEGVGNGAEGSGGEGDEVEVDEEEPAEGEDPGQQTAGQVAAQAAVVGPLAFRLHHEVRSLHHQQYMRPLYNRVF